MRSQQLLALFDKSSFVSKKKEKELKLDGKLITRASLEELKIGKLVQNPFRQLICNNNHNKELLLNLQDKEFCSKEFKVGFPVLVKKYSEYETVRYYKDPLTIDGNEYMLTSQWYERSKKKLIAWIMDHAK